VIKEDGASGNYQNGTLYYLSTWVLENLSWQFIQAKVRLNASLDEGKLRFDFKPADHRGFM
jgi:hypothetical protein